MKRNTPLGLGTLLRRLQELTDGELERIYAEDGLDYIPRYTPVMRALVVGGSRTVRDIAQASGVSHSAASQTVSRMVEAGLVKLSVGLDARERHAQLTKKAISMLPQLRACWAATEAAAQSIEDDIGTPLRDVLIAAITVLEERSFSLRIRMGRKG